MLAKGFYALPRSAYRDGTIPERMTLEQGGLSIPMRGLAFWRSSEWRRPAGVNPGLDLHLFKIRPQAGFNPAEPFGLGLHFDLARNHLIRDQGRLSSEWQLPSRFFIAQEEQPGWEVRQPLWLQLWRDRAISIGVLVVALGFVTFLFLRQSLFIAPGRHLRRWRYAVLIFTTGFIGYYAIDGGDGHAATICMFETQADCEQADKKALEWAGQNLGEFLAGPPEVTAGDALIVET